MKRNSHLSAFIVLSVCVYAMPLSAGYVPYVSGQSTAALIEEGEFAGLYRYDIAVSWSMRTKLTELDLLLTNLEQKLDYKIVFPKATSSSKRHSWDLLAANWTAYLQSNVSSLFDEDDFYIKYISPIRPHFLRAGKSGCVTLSFYSNIAPEYGTFDDVLIAEGNWKQKIFGDLSGAYPNPSCSSNNGGGDVPEPATIALLGLSSYFIAVRRKR